MANGEGMLSKRWQPLSPGKTSRLVRHCEHQVSAIHDILVADCKAGYRLAVQFYGFDILVGFGQTFGFDSEGLAFGEHLKHIRH